MTKYSDCTFCSGRVIEKQVQKACWWGDKLLALVDNVPAGVCEQCGERYYKAKVLKNIENQLKEKKTFDRQVCIPMASYHKNRNVTAHTD